MFTWNYQYISKAILEKTFEQTMLAKDGGDVLVRIHTAIHLEDEAVELARFIKSLVPTAKIIGTSTSAVINRGKLAMNQCVISVTQMNSATVRTLILPTVDEKSGLPLSVDSVCSCAKQTVMQKDMKLLFAFLAGEFFRYRPDDFACQRMCPRREDDRRHRESVRHRAAEGLRGRLRI